MFANGISATFRNGILIEIKQKDEIIPLNNGPLPVGMKANFKEGYEYMQGNDACYIAKYEGGIDSIVWRMSGDGLLGMEAVLLNDPKGHGFEGAFFRTSFWYQRRSNRRRKSTSCTNGGH